GDEVLQLFAERVRHNIRTTSDCVARYGGEEFVIVLPETPFEGGLQAAEKIRASVAASLFETSAGELKMTASMGVGSVRGNVVSAYASVDSLIRFADESLYHSKQAGRNRVTGHEITAPDAVELERSAGAA